MLSSINNFFDLIFEEDNKAIFAPALAKEMQIFLPMWPVDPVTIHVLFFKLFSSFFEGLLYHLINLFYYKIFLVLAFLHLKLI